MARGSHSSPQRTKHKKSRKAINKSIKRVYSNDQLIKKYQSTPASE